MLTILRGWVHSFGCWATDLKNFVVALLVRDEEVSELLSLDSEDLLSLLLETLDPLVVGHVDDVDREDQPPVEVVQLEIALLAPEQAVVLILDLETQKATFQEEILF